MAILGGQPISAVPVSGLATQAAAAPDNVIRPPFVVSQATARAGRREIFQPITVRGDPAAEPAQSFATPGPIVVLQSGPSVIQAQKFLSVVKRAHFEDDPVLTTGPPKFVNQALTVPRSTAIFAPITSRASLEDAAPVSVSSPKPIVVLAAPAPRVTPATVTSRASLQDFASPQPVVIGQAVPRSLTRDLVETIILKGDPTAAPPPATASPSPIVISTSFVNTLARAIVKQITMRGDPTAAPVLPPVEPPSGGGAGTLPGHWGKRPRWWIEIEKERKKEARFPDLPPPPDLAPPWKLKVVTKDVRRVLDNATKAWRAKREKAKRAEDALIAAIIITLMAEQDKDKDG